VRLRLPYKAIPGDADKAPGRTLRQIRSILLRAGIGSASGVLSLDRGDSWLVRHLDPSWCDEQKDQSIVALVVIYASASADTCILPGTYKLLAAGLRSRLQQPSDRLISSPEEIKHVLSRGELDNDI
jgi:hypothetical protein